MHVCACYLWDLLCLPTCGAVSIIIVYDTGRYPLGILIGIQRAPPTVLNGVGCRGTERNITECTHVFNGDCVRSGAGVICPALNGLL